MSSKWNNFINSFADRSSFSKLNELSTGVLYGGTITSDYTINKVDIEAGVGINQGGTTWRNLVYCTADYIRFHTAGVSRIDVDANGHLIPVSNNTYNLGSSSLRWANIFTNDLHLSNMNKPGGNDVDGTKGDWTIQEGAENLYIINNNNGKKYKITLEETL